MTANEQNKFDFEKLIVYEKSLLFYGLIRKIEFSRSETDRIISKQLYRAALSISLNIAEGTGRKSFKDRRNFYVISRGSTFECAAIIRAILMSTSEDQQPLLLKAYHLSVEIAKMLSTMIAGLDRKISSMSK